MPIGNGHYEPAELAGFDSGEKPSFQQQDLLDTTAKVVDNNLSFRSNKSKSIMIVEDNDEIRDYLRSLLEQD